MLNIAGVLFAGKSTLFKHLENVLKVHRLKMLADSSLEQHLTYSEGSDLLLIDDMSKETLDLLLARHTIFDGLPLVGNKKYEEQQSFDILSIVLTSNLVQPELMTQSVCPSKDDQYYHIKTRGYHWKAVATRPTQPKEISSDELEFALAEIIQDVLKNGDQ